MIHTLIVLSGLTKAGTLLLFESTIDVSKNPEITPEIAQEVGQLPFFRIPKDHADGYAGAREESPLGRVFSIANRNQDHIDALVVIGSDLSLSGIRALIKARCDPFHNETDRATRGSKPRVYFLSGTSDNDLVAATIDRLSRRSLSALQRRFGLVLIADQTFTQREMDLADLIVRHSLETQTQEPQNDWGWQSPPPIVLVKGDRVRVNDTIMRGATDRFVIDDALEGASTLLTPAGLLPLAFLGLNCIKLLEGALAVSQDFSSDPAKHWTFEYSKTRLLFKRIDGQPILAVHREAFEPLVRWAMHLEGRDGDPVFVLPRDLGSLVRLIEQMPAARIHHVDTVGHRHDVLPIEEGKGKNQGGMNSLSGDWSRLVLPALDMEALGRFVQGSLIASALCAGK